MKILFLYDQRYPQFWRDGVWRAVKELEKSYDVTWNNLISQAPSSGTYDVVIARGDWNGLVEKTARTIDAKKRALYICGNVQEPKTAHLYDTLFYESDYQLEQIKDHPHKYFAFGVNTEINRPMKSTVIWDYMTVGAFALWKRQEKMLLKEGTRLAVGEIQRENLPESMSIISGLLSGGVMISDMVDPETLAKIYNASQCVYIPASLSGGGERAVLEARACGRMVEVEDDNPKLLALLKGPIYDHQFIYSQFLKCL